MALARSISDHCLMMLTLDKNNWGPRPTHMLKCWSDIPGYKDFVKEKLPSFHIEGWSDYVLKEKFKLIKGSLKRWHQSHTQNLKGKISKAKDHVFSLDVKSEEEDPVVEEMEELHSFSVEVLSLSKLHSSMQWQKSRLNWLHEGDANSKKIHAFMSSRMRKNNIISIIVDHI